jgi:hypothetical protein
MRLMLELEAQSTTDYTRMNSYEEKKKKQRMN